MFGQIRNKKKVLFKLHVSKDKNTCVFRPWHKGSKRKMYHPISISFYHKHSYVRSKNHIQNKLFEHFMVGNKMRQTCELYPLWLLKVIISHLFNYAAWRLQVSTRSLYLFLWGDRRPVVQKWHKGKYFFEKIRIEEIEKL